MSKKFICPICGYVYDDSAGQAWNELPDDWKCPLCGAPKAVFRPEGGQEQKAEEVAAIDLLSHFFNQPLSFLSVLHTY